MSHKKIFGTILAIVVLSGVAFALSSMKGSVVSAPGGDFEPKRMTLSGTFGCLQLKDPNAPMTKECRPGLRTDDDTWYALDFSLMSQAAPVVTDAQRVTASGVVTPVERLSADMWKKYEVEGIFSVTDGVAVADYRQTTYEVDGASKKLGAGLTYFGNEAHGDFDGDGTEDVAFLATADTKGSGTFYYLLVALWKDGAYTGLPAGFIGDRIAPQATESAGSLIIVNYADRASGEPFSAKPSVAVSKYFQVKDGALREIKK